MVTAVPLHPTAIERSSRLFAGDTLSLWQQPLVLTDTIQSLLLLIYALSGVLFLLSGLWPQGYNFVPVALVSLAPLAGALLIRPFTFGAVFLLVAMAGVVLLIQSERAGTVRPALRYVLLGLLATCLLLIAGWLICPEQTGLQTTAARLLAVAFVMLMAGFPFYIWVIPAASRTPLLARVFVLAIVPLVVSVFLLAVLAEYDWLAQDVQFQLWLRWSGLLTVLVAGLSALTADPRRLLGSLVLLDMGVVILALASADQQTLVLLHLARGTGLLLAGIGLEQPARWRRWLFLYGCASLLGLPFTPGFFGRWAIITQLPDTSAVVLLTLGLAGGLFGLWHYLHHSTSLVSVQPAPL
jgi:formate hydrogenlyase subunit 3/multisubunit Na+/H+ antiporter MnhD subunit